MNRIIFGSPEAKAILSKDRELQRVEALFEMPEDSNQLADRLEELESEIENLEMEINCLVDEAEEIRGKLKAKPPEPKATLGALRKWNAWATGTLVTQ